MSADRERHTMTDRDIALLLADAADGVEVGIAPTQAVIRGGRRRRARRWAIATATALAIVGSTATLALAGLPGGDGHEVAPAATQRPTTTPDAFQDAPHRTTLATGTEDGKEWKVYIDAWGAPRDKVEAEAQLTAMAEYQESPPDVRTASELVGKTAYFVYRSYGDKGARVIENTLPADGIQRSTDLDAGSLPLVPGTDGPSRLVVGRVAGTAQQVTCTWKDGPSTLLHRVPATGATTNVEQGIRSAEGSKDDWFVCLAPQNTSFQSVAVTK